MMMLPSITILLWAIAAGCAAAYVTMKGREITYVTLADGRRTARSLPLAIRLLLPLAPNFRRVVSRPCFAAMRTEAERLIISSGLEGLLTGEEFTALKMLFPLTAGLMMVAMIWTMGGLLGEDFGVAQRFALTVGALAWAWWWPSSWLKRTYRRRHLNIMKALPFVLDLLTLSVEAGMDFMRAIARNCERRKMDALNEELLRMMHEIQVGTPRRIALKNMAERVGQPDLKSVSYALIQADELGVSIGSVLRIQSEQLRGKRFDRAEKSALEAPVKMLGPLMLCIFPAVFLVLLAPVLLQAAKGLFG